MEIYQIIILIIVFLLIILILSLSYYLYHHTFKNHHKKDIDDYYYLNQHYYDDYRNTIIEGIKKSNELEYQEIDIQAYDSSKLHGRLFISNKEAPFILLSHGFKSTPIRDFALIIPKLKEAGYNLLLIDQRGQGKSDGHILYFGEKERYDILRWTNYLNDSGYSNNPIIYYGLSLGASTVLMAESLDLPANVCGIIADSPYSSPIKAIREVAQYQIHLNKYIVGFLTFMGALLYGHFNLVATDCIRSIKNKDIPILLLQGDKDRLVPNWMSEDIYQASPKQVQLEIFKGAKHMLAMYSEEDRYLNLVFNFIKERTKYENKTQSPQ